MKFVANYFFPDQWPHMPMVEVIEAPDLAEATKQHATVIANQLTDDVRVKYHPERGSIFIEGTKSFIVVMEYPKLE